MIIGLTGNQGCGKNAVADTLKKELERLGKNVVITHFSTSLKKAAVDCLAKEFFSLYLMPFFKNEVKFLIENFPKDTDEIDVDHIEDYIVDIFDGNGIFRHIRDKKITMYKDDIFTDENKCSSVDNRNCLISIMDKLLNNYIQLNEDLPKDYNKNILLDTIDDWMSSSEYDEQAGVSIRDFLIILGTHMRSWISQDYWVNEWEKDIKNIQYDFNIVKDIRMDNEATAVMNNNGLIFDIYREGITNKTSTTHVTERGISHNLIASIITNKEGDIDFAAKEIIELVHPLYVNYWRN